MFHIQICDLKKRFQGSCAFSRMRCSARMVKNKLSEKSILEKESLQVQHTENGSWVTRHFPWQVTLSVSPLVFIVSISWMFTGRCMGYLDPDPALLLGMTAHGSAFLSWEKAETASCERVSLWESQPLQM